MNCAQSCIKIDKYTHRLVIEYKHQTFKATEYSFVCFNSDRTQSNHAITDRWLEPSTTEMVLNHFVHYRSSPKCNIVTFSALYRASSDSGCMHIPIKTFIRVCLAVSKRSGGFAIFDRSALFDGGHSIIQYDTTLNSIIQYYTVLYNYSTLDMGKEAPSQHVPSTSQSMLFWTTGGDLDCKLRLRRVQLHTKRSFSSTWYRSKKIVTYLWW